MRILASLLALLVVAAPAAAGSITVSGKSNPWLAGMPEGTQTPIDPAGGVDTILDTRPVLVDFLALGAGNILTFSVTGAVRNFGDNECLNPGFCPALDGPDGGVTLSGDPNFTSHNFGPEFGKSDINAPVNALLGVFLGPGPLDTTAPNALNFANIGLDFTHLAPEVEQVFFIGDGLAGQIRQGFVIPDGATRFYLGTMDGYQWRNNIGEFVVTVNEEPIPTPEPASLALLGAGLAALRLRRRRSR